jgi:hypothetical protein
VLRKNPSVKQLFDHGWIHLFAFRDQRCDRYTPQGWRAVGGARESFQGEFQV